MKLEQIIISMEDGFYRLDEGISEAMMALPEKSKDDFKVKVEKMYMKLNEGRDLYNKLIEELKSKL